MAKPPVVGPSQLDPRDRGIDLGEWLGLISGAAGSAFIARYLMGGGMEGDQVPLIGELPPGIASRFAIESSDILQAGVVDLSGRFPQLDTLHIPCLKIEERYEQLASLGVHLGMQTWPRADGDRAMPDSIGQFRGYENGIIYWHPDVPGCAHAVYGDIFSKLRFKKTAADFFTQPLTPLGYPTSELATSDDGRFGVQQFQNGWIFVVPELAESPIERTFVVKGEILDKWILLAQQGRSLGFPITEIRDYGNQEYQLFERGYILVTQGGRSVGRVAVANELHTWVKIIQYNVQFLTPHIPFLPLQGEIREHWPNTSERARAIGRELACYDIIALQETINDERRGEILEEMEREGRNCGKPSLHPDGRIFHSIAGPPMDLRGSGGLEYSGEDPWDVFDPESYNWNENFELRGIVGNELTLISRFPIIRADYHVYRNASGIDAAAAKGILYARLWRGGNTLPSDFIDVFVTHLQAGDENIRALQLQELRNFIGAKVDLSINRPLMILGDFNIIGNVPEQYDNNSEYNRMVRALRSSPQEGRLGRLRDFWRDERGANEGPTNEERDKRIDFIFHSAPYYWSSIEARVERYSRYRFPSLVVEQDDGSAREEGRIRIGLSDHAAVRVDIAWGPPLDEIPGVLTLSDSKHITLRVRRLQSSSDESSFFLQLLPQGSTNPYQRSFPDLGRFRGNDIRPNNVLIGGPVRGGIRTVHARIDVLYGTWRDGELVDINPTRGGGLSLEIDLTSGEIRNVGSVPTLRTLEPVPIYIPGQEWNTVVGRVGQDITLGGAGDSEETGTITFVIEVRPST